MISSARPVRVLVVDDSRTIRSMIRSVLDPDDRFEVVGEAGDPYAARDAIKIAKPDVLTLDVEMPRMNGLVFLRNLMRLRPMPVVMVSTRTSEQSEDAVTALSLGAVDCIDLKKVHGAPDIRSKLTETLLTAASAQLRRTDAANPNATFAERRSYEWNEKYVLIGSSTGGVEALERVFASYPADCPPTLVAQHMPANFLTSFANRLNNNLAPKVQVAENSKPVEPGNIYLAPGGQHHLAIKRAHTPRLELIEDVGDQLHIPAVDVLFRSGVPLGNSIVSVMLTGMGSDGADAMLALREAGAETIAQDAKTAVIDGMPGAARRNGAAKTVLALDKIGAAILSRCGSFVGEDA